MRFGVQGIFLVSIAVVTGCSTQDKSGTDSTEATTAASSATPAAAASGASSTQAAAASAKVASRATDNLYYWAGYKVSQVFGTDSLRLYGYGYVSTDNMGDSFGTEAGLTGTLEDVSDAQSKISGKAPGGNRPFVLMPNVEAVPAVVGVTSPSGLGGLDAPQIQLATFRFKNGKAPRIRVTVKGDHGSSECIADLSSGSLDDPKSFPACEKSK